MSASFLISALMIATLLIGLGFAEVRSQRKFDRTDKDIEQHLASAARMAKRKAQWRSGKREVTGIDALPSAWFREDES